MLKPNWKEHARGEASIGAITFMLADLHVRTLRLEGKNVEADEYEALRDATESAMAVKRLPASARLWHRITGQ